MQGNDGRGVETVEPRVAQLPEVVGRGIARTEIHQLQGRIVGEAVPDRAASLEFRVAMGVPGLRGRGEIRALERLTGSGRHGKETPLELSGVEVVGGDVAAHAADAHVAAAVAYDHHVPGDLRSARARVGELVVDDGVDFPDLLARGGVERMQTPVGRGDVHLALPYRDAPVDEIAARLSSRERGRLGVVAPQLLARGCIERVDVAPGSRGVHDAVDDGRCRLLSALRSPEIVGPGEAQLADVRGGDVRQR